jgi:hypothetical protein
MTPEQLKALTDTLAALKPLHARLDALADELLHGYDGHSGEGRSAAETDADRQRDYVQNAQLEYVKMAHAEWLEGFKGVKDFSSNAIRMLYVSNGGAILALLALIGEYIRQNHARRSVAAF